MFSNKSRQQSAQTMMEYLLVMVVVAAVVFGAFTLPKGGIADKIRQAANLYFDTGAAAIMGGYYEPGAGTSSGRYVQVNPKAINGAWCSWTMGVNGFKSRECACPRPAFGGLACDGAAVAVAGYTAPYCGNGLIWITGMGCGCPSGTHWDVTQQACVAGAGTTCTGENVVLLNGACVCNPVLNLVWDQVSKACVSKIEVCDGTKGLVKNGNGDCVCANDTQWSDGLGKCIPMCGLSNTTADLGVTCFCPMGTNWDDDHKICTSQAACEGAGMHWIVPTTGNPYCGCYTHEYIANGACVASNFDCTAAKHMYMNGSSCDCIAGYHWDASIQMCWSGGSTCPNPNTVWDGQKCACMSGFHFDQQFINMCVSDTIVCNTQKGLVQTMDGTCICKNGTQMNPSTGVCEVAGSCTPIDPVTQACGLPYNDCGVTKAGTYCDFGTCNGSSCICTCPAPNAVACGRSVKDDCGNPCPNAGTYCDIGTCDGTRCSSSCTCPPVSGVRCGDPVYDTCGKYNASCLIGTFCSSGHCTGSSCVQNCTCPDQMSVGCGVAMDDGCGRACGKGRLCSAGTCVDGKCDTQCHCDASFHVACMTQYDNGCGNYCGYGSAMNCGPFNCGTDRCLNPCGSCGNNQSCRILYTNSAGVCVDTTCICPSAATVACGTLYDDNCKSACGSGTKCDAGTCINGKCELCPCASSDQVWCGLQYRDSCGNFCGTGTFCYGMPCNNCQYSGQGSCPCTLASALGCGVKYQDACGNQCVGNKGHYDANLGKYVNCGQ